MECDMDFSHDTCKMVIFHESFEENPLIKKFFNHRDYIVEFSDLLDEDTCYTPLSRSLFVLVDFARFQNLDGEDDFVAELANLVHKGQHFNLLWMASEINKELIESSYSIQKKFEMIVCQPIFNGLATNWNDACEVIIRQNECMSHENMEFMNYEKDLRNQEKMLSCVAEQEFIKNLQLSGISHEKLGEVVHALSVIKRKPILYK